jgi:heme/copper-type cytochrome/quinol oxidase subunit 2
MTTRVLVIAVLGSIAIVGEAAAIAASVEGGNAGTTFRVLVAATLVVGMSATVAAACWPWMRRVRNIEKGGPEWKYNRVLVVLLPTMLIALASYLVISLLAHTVQFATYTEELSMFQKEEDKISRDRESAERSIQIAEERLGELELRWAAAKEAQEPLVQHLARDEIKFVRTQLRGMQSDLLAVIRKLPSIPVEPRVNYLVPW